MIGFDELQDFYQYLEIDGLDDRYYQEQVEEGCEFILMVFLPDFPEEFEDLADFRISFMQETPSRFFIESMPWETHDIGVGRGSLPFPQKLKIAKSILEKIDLSAKEVNFRYLRVLEAKAQHWAKYEDFDVMLVVHEDPYGGSNSYEWKFTAKETANANLKNH